MNLFKSISKSIRTVAAGFGFVAASAAMISSTAQAADITGAGATFPYPIFAKWAEDYKKVTGVGLNYQSIGSSGGIRQIRAKTVTFGATDAPLKGEDLDKDGMVQFPVILGGVVPVINLDGFKPGELRVNGEVLAEMFAGGQVKSKALGASIGRMAAARQVAYLDLAPVATVSPIDGIHFDEITHHAIGQAVYKAALPLLS